MSLNDLGSTTIAEAQPQAIRTSIAEVEEEAQATNQEISETRSNISSIRNQVPSDNQGTENISNSGEAVMQSLIGKLDNLMNRHQSLLTRIDELKSQLETIEDQELKVNLGKTLEELESNSQEVLKDIGRALGVPEEKLDDYLAGNFQPDASALSLEDPERMEAFMSFLQSADEKLSGFEKDLRAIEKKLGVASVSDSEELEAKENEEASSGGGSAGASSPKDKSIDVKELYKDFSKLSKGGSAEELIDFYLKNKEELDAFIKENLSDSEKKALVEDIVAQAEDIRNRDDLTQAEKIQMMDALKSMLDAIPPELKPDDSAFHPGKSSEDLTKDFSEAIKQNDLEKVTQIFMDDSSKLKEGIAKLSNKEKTEIITGLNELIESNEQDPVTTNVLKQIVKGLN